MRYHGPVRGGIGVLVGGCIGLAVAAGCDGPSSDSASDALDTSTPYYCPPLEPSSKVGAFTFYLNMDGVTISKGACDDSRTNCSSLVAQEQTVVPRFLDSLFDVNRQRVIDQTTAHVRAALARWSVNTPGFRPSVEHYSMIVTGGANDMILGQNVFSASQPTCNLQNRDSIGFTFDHDPIEAQGYANEILYTFGRLVGLAPSTTVGDCMCLRCISGTDLCSFTDNAATDPANDCGRGRVQDELHYLAETLGCR
jgi:hypothetical protein